MVYIGTTSDNGSAIYFDMHSAERQGRGVRISGTIGDGCYEGEVLVEIGVVDSVTFADAWLGGTGYSEFLDRCDATILKSTLIETVRETPLFHARRSQPHGNGRAFTESFVSEPLPLWHPGV
jgi:hypothetical protein